VFPEPEGDGFALVSGGMPVSVLTDDPDAGVLRAVNDLQEDFRRVTGNLPFGLMPNAVIIGTAGKSALVDRLIQSGRVDGAQLAGKSEAYLLQTVRNPLAGVENALVIAGAGKRGTIYGVYELSAQIGVSPWYYWADVPVKRQTGLYVKRGAYTDGEPAVKYRGIFLNDEAPALSGWADEKFGGFNHQFYEKVFELLLRLRGNFLWPAMWGRAFYDDDGANGALADRMGVVIGTSHHEPLGRAHDEWRRYGRGPWNYAKNADVLSAFWRGGMERMKDYETVVTIGMRGDGDEAMSEEADIALLERIVDAQRGIIGEVTGKPSGGTPQVWALYKEVQDYYDRGMRVPDDVTLLLCDDNWGNVRKLPDINAPARAGGYGMYYHFDYVGGPRNYKWINISPVQRVWEQMNLAYSHGVDRIWVVNAGDLKPMEYPVSFFLDMAWRPEAFNAQNLALHTEAWCAVQFGAEYAAEAARIISLYTKFNRRVSPELLDADTYSLENYGEFERVTNEYKDLALDAFRLYNLLPAGTRDAFDELVLFPVNACANLYEMYFAVAKNRYYAARNDPRANAWAEKAHSAFERDAALTRHYNNDIAGGKWAHMMDQVRIGYTSWQQPEESVMPRTEYVAPPAEKTAREHDGFTVIEAGDYARAAGTERIHWEVIPGFGRTEAGVTTFPQNACPGEKDAVYLEYDIEFETPGEKQVHLYLAPTLNFNANRGLRYAVSFDGGAETVVNFNGHYRGEPGKWQAESIIVSTTAHTIPSAGAHTLRFRVLEPGIVPERIVIDGGGLKPSYLGGD